MYLYKDALERFSIKWQSGTQLFHMKLIICELWISRLPQHETSSLMDQFRFHGVFRCIG